MGIFDGSKSEQIKYLEDERKKIWDRVVLIEKEIYNLKKEILNKASESQKEAAQSSRKTAEYRNKTEHRYNEAEAIFSKIQTIQQQIESNYNQSNELLELFTSKNKEVELILEQAKIEKQRLLDEISSVESLKGKFEEFFEEYPNLDVEIDKIENFISVIDDNSQKSELSVTAINNRKNDIDKVYREIFGYMGKNDLGVETKVEGLKDELSKTYNDLSNQLDSSLDRIGQINKEFEERFLIFERSFKDKYISIIDQIERLLPGALTTGLSAAYSAKKSEENEALKNNKVNFRSGIIALGVISLIPVLISILFIFQKIGLTEVIERLPRIVIAIIPVYIPALWYTFSASKKVNLSKRLIEEYTHKEVLSKTFEGLSKQIESLGNDSQSEELKIRLLTNILQVSSENPGKLISNYNSSDHPVMEALEQSYKLQIAIDKLEGIPGMGKIAAIIESSSKKKLENKAKKIEEAFDSSEDDKSR